MRSILVPVAALLALAGCSSPASTVAEAAPPAAESTEVEAPPIADVGQTVTFDDGYGSSGTITVHSARRVAHDPLYEPPASGDFVVIDVTVTSNAVGVSADPYSFRAQTADGRTYDYAPEAPQQPISADPIPPGRKVRGEVAFDAPRGELLIDFMPGLTLAATFRVTT